MNTKKLDYINIIDLEATNDPAAVGDVKAEIIEIGIARLWLADKKITDARSTVIRPVYTKINSFIEGLTGWTQEEVDKGMLYAEAVEILLKEYKSKTHAWGSYGDYDRKMFVRMGELFRVPYPFGNEFLNIKLVVPIMLGWEKTMGCERAVERAGLKFKGKAHRGINDAVATAELFAHALNKVQK